MARSDTNSPEVEVEISSGFNYIRYILLIGVAIFIISITFYYLRKKADVELDSLVQAKTFPFNEILATYSCINVYCINCESASDTAVYTSRTLEKVKKAKAISYVGVKFSSKFELQQSLLKDLEKSLSTIQTKDKSYFVVNNCDK